VPANVTLAFDTLGSPASRFALRDLLAHRDLGVYTTAYTTLVAPHAVAHVILSPA
jgi:hypothetical protein